MRAAPLTQSASFLPLLTVAALALPASVSAAQRPVVEYVKCWPVSSCAKTLSPPSGGWLLIKANAVPSSPIVRFRGAGNVVAKRLRGNRLLVKVPENAKPGSMRFKAKGTFWSAPFGFLHPSSAAGEPAPPTPTGSAFDGNGMWIWELWNTERGNVAAIIAKAKAHDISTVFIKSGDGDHNWSQFTPALISQLHAGGLQVCAWPYVYGKKPAAEAAQTIRSIKMGADCLAIDAETEYQGRYSQALQYITAIRKAVGASYPISLAGFPYVDYHLNFPYSVVFGPGGVQYNQPQAYWRDIGGGVDKVMSHTYMANLPYGKRIVPIGQVWQSPKASELVRFRSLAAVWDSPGVSWWDWQEAPAKLWTPLGSTLAWPPSRMKRPEWIVISKGSRGDLALWAQMHLNAAGAKLKADGDFGTGTRNAVMSFQAARGIPVTGTIGQATWKALLRVPLPKPVWAAAIAQRAANPQATRSARTRSEFRTQKASKRR